MLAYLENFLKQDQYVRLNLVLNIWNAWCYQFSLFPHRKVRHFNLPPEDDHLVTETNAEVFIQSFGMWDWTLMTSEVEYCWFQRRIYETKKSNDSYLRKENRE